MYVIVCTVVHVYSTVVYGTPIQYNIPVHLSTVCKQTAMVYTHMCGVLCVKSRSLVCLCKICLPSLNTIYFVQSYRFIHEYRALIINSVQNQVGSYSIRLHITFAHVSCTYYSLTTRLKRSYTGTVFAWPLHLRLSEICSVLVDLQKSQQNLNKTFGQTSEQKSE